MIYRFGKISTMIFASVLPIFAVDLFAAEKVDRRALENCRSRGGSFVQINDCLPEAHVAYAKLDAFDKYFDGKASVLKSECLSNNEKIEAALACVTAAIQAAIELKDKLPVGAKLDDPLFDQIAKESAFGVINFAGEQAKKLFPDKRLWGMTMYQPYRGQ